MTLALKSLEKIESRVAHITRRLEKYLEDDDISYDDIEEYLTATRHETLPELREELEFTANRHDNQSTGENDDREFEKRYNVICMEIKAAEGTLDALDRRFDVFDPYAELKGMFPDEDPDYEDFDDGLNPEELY